jgi:hypothetical protein
MMALATTAIIITITTTTTTITVPNQTSIVTCPCYKTAWLTATALIRIEMSAKRRKTP